MTHPLLEQARTRTDADLTAHVTSLAARGRSVNAELVAHLSELLRRGLDAAAGFGSAHEYCRVVLKLSEGEAYNRLTAAGVVRRFPAVLDLLVSGAVNLTTVTLLARHLTPDNHLLVLEAASGRRKAQVEELVASLAPRPDVPTVTRRLPPPAPVPRPAEPLLTAPVAAPAAAQTPVTALPTPASPRFQPAVRALAPDRYAYQTTIDAETRDLLAAARDLLRHVEPRVADGPLLKKALAALVEDLLQRRFAVGTTRRAVRTSHPGARKVPAAVMRAVYLRDQGRCAFVGGSQRCEGRAFLELHHVRPFAAGGPSTAENVQLRCRRHNQHEARVYFDPIRQARAAAQR